MPNASLSSMKMVRSNVVPSLLVLLVLTAATVAHAQRVQFPTMVSQGSGTVPAMQPTPPGPQAPATAPAAAPSAATPQPTYTPQPTTPQPTYTPTPQPTYTPQPSLAPTTPGTAPPPSATYGGTVPTAPSGWDPYAAAAPGAATPYAPPPAGTAGQPPALFPDGFSLGSGTYGMAAPALPGQQYQRLFQEIRFEFTWLPSGNGTNKLGVTDLELFGTLAFPVFRNKETPLLVTPGFAVHFFDGPLTTATSLADMPPQTYDAYLDLAWQPRITPWLGGDLGFRTGVYSDFSTANSDSLRFMGRGLGVITLTPTMQVSAGVVYLDRNRVKLLPAGGLIWTPTPDRRWEIVFPNPKLACRIREIGTTQWWWYVSGEYGGGSWAISRDTRLQPPGTDDDDSVDYNDIRAILGLEWVALSGMRGFIEAGYVFDRELVYRKVPPRTLSLSEVFMLRSGVAF